MQSANNTSLQRLIDAEYVAEWKLLSYEKESRATNRLWWMKVGAHKEEISESQVSCNNYEESS